MCFRVLFSLIKKIKKRGRGGAGGGGGVNGVAALAGGGQGLCEMDNRINILNEDWFFFLFFNSF